MKRSIVIRSGRIELRDQCLCLDRGESGLRRRTAGSGSCWRALVRMANRARDREPETVIAWHRQGFRLWWTWKSRRRLGRPAVPADIRALIRTMAEANPRWGAPRIHGEQLTPGIDVSQATVAK